MAFNLFRKASVEAPATKASAAGPLVAFHSAGRPAWTPRDAPALTRAGFQGNPVGFRCVRMIAEAVAAVPILAFARDARLIDHPLISLLEQPNPGQDGRTLVEAIIGHLQLSGDAYVELTLGADGAPAELYALRPDRMRVVPGTDGWPVAYEYSVGGRKHRFDATAEIPSVLHVRSYHPLDDHYGLSPLEAAATATDIHNAASKWSKALLDNAARPSGAIVYSGGEGGLTDAQYNRLTEEIESNHQGARNAGRPMLLEGGLDWKPMGFSPSDMEFLKTKEAAAREIALAFGVPPMILGLPGDNTYSNYQEANRAFYRQTVLPLSRKLCASITCWLGGAYAEQVRLEPDIDSVSALAPERDAHWKRIAEAGFLDEDEKRALLGVPPRRTTG